MAIKKATSSSKSTAVATAPATKGPGRPAIPVLTTNLAHVSPKGASFRLDAYPEGTKVKDIPEGEAAVLNVYLNRAALLKAGIPAGKMPTMVEVTFRILKTADEPVSE